MDKPFPHEPPLSHRYWNGSPPYPQGPFYESHETIGVKALRAHPFLYEFPVTAVTNGPQLGGLKQRTFMLLLCQRSGDSNGCQRAKIRVSAGCVPLGGSTGVRFLPLPASGGGHVP